MELTCAALQCHEPAKVIVGGYSLCGEHQGNAEGVRQSYLEQVTGEQIKSAMESMISMVMPVVAEFVQSGELERLLEPLRTAFLDMPPNAPEDGPSPE